MQGLPFDDAEFPGQGVSVSVSSTWMESPRGVTTANVAATAAANSAMQPSATNGIPTDEEIYRMVGAPSIANPSHQMASPSNVLPQFSPQQALPPRPIPQQRPQPGQHHHHQGSSPSPQQQQHPSQPQQPPSFSQAHMLLPQQATHAQLQSANTHMQIHAVAHDPTIGPSTTAVTRRRRGGGMAGISTDASGKTENAVPLEHQLPMTAPKRKIVRSAVEEARLRAQREAESFANSRRDTTKRDAATKIDIWETVTTDRRTKRPKSDGDGTGTGTGEGRRGGGSTTSAAQGDEGAKREDDSEAEKQERYKRRLDMNRESAAVSRVRRRAYVKELEERLAAVEAEKLQLEGKLEIMLSQNEDLKKQLDRLFMMVASGRRPTYSPQEEGAPGQQ